jgi:hypothetical protein
MKFQKLILPTLTALAWLSANNTNAQDHPVLQFTELSDTVLQVTLAGEPQGTVVNLGRDQWEWHSGMFAEGLQSSQDLLIGIPFGQAQWIEPENGSLVNLVTFVLFPTLGTLDVKPAQALEVGALIESDKLFVEALSGNTYDNGKPGGDVQLGDPSRTVTPLFLDVGDAQTGVPDSGSTSVLVLGASFALAGLRQLRARALA